MAIEIPKRLEDLPTELVERTAVALASRLAGGEGDLPRELSPAPERVP